MKIRNGFVSNSSSSSFVLVKPTRIPELNEIEDFYGINKNLDSRLRTWLSFIIWNELNEGKTVMDKPVGDWFFNENSMAWDIEHRGKTPGYFKKCKENISDYAEHVIIEVGSEYGYRAGDLVIPTSIAQELDDKCDELFTKPEIAFVINEH